MSFSLTRILFFNRFKAISHTALIWLALACSKNSSRLKRLDCFRILFKEGRCRHNDFILFVCDKNGWRYPLSLYMLHDAAPWISCSIRFVHDPTVKMFISTTSFVVLILLLVASDRGFGFGTSMGHWRFLSWLWLLVLLFWNPRNKKPYLFSVHYVTRMSPLRGTNWLRLPLRYDPKSVSDVENDEFFLLIIVRPGYSVDFHAVTLS